MNDQVLYDDIPLEKLCFAKDTDRTHDVKLDTKPVGYFRDAFRRFKRNKSSVVAAVIILFLILFTIVGPILSDYTTTFNDMHLSKLLPKSEVFSFLGWDGCQKASLSAPDYFEYRALEQEVKGLTVIRDMKGTSEVETKIGAIEYVDTFYNCYVDSYTRHAMQFIQVTYDEYVAIQQYQDEHNVQIIYPALQERDNNDIYRDDANVWYVVQTTGKNKGLPEGYKGPDQPVDYVNYYILKTGGDKYVSKMRIENGDLYDYAVLKQGGNYKLRVNYNEYFAMMHEGEYPQFLFGSDQYGKDIFVRLSSGARFSLLFAVAISIINLTLGAIYGAVEGYYGGVTDLVMERISDILSGVPFMVVVTLFKLHIADKVGVVPTLLFAFVSTGWIGMAGTVRMQFYRFKNQEYVLSARTLGAKDLRIMFKHIFPNSLGTIITSCVLVIPGVIFSESSLSYLGIINLSTSNVTSVGTLLANGQGYLSSFPHIILFPAIFIALLEISFNLFGNGLRDAFNPSLRGTED